MRQAATTAFPRQRATIESESSRTVSLPEQISIRTATPGESAAIHSLVVKYLAEGHLLPRELEEIATHAHRFVVAVDHDRVIGCAELAPLSVNVAEVRSLVVDRNARSRGVSRLLLDELVTRATAAGFEKLCAFTHDPAYFVHFGFSIVPHVWLPEKIVTDCRRCVHFRQCGQYAVVRALGRPHRSTIRLTALQG
jgi:N-acetylglutamate synthase-like GNAT family acetyltransferase